MVFLIGGKPSGAAQIVHEFAKAALGPQVEVGIRCWDDTHAGCPDAPLQLNLRNRMAMRRLLWSPNELGFARAYVSGDLDIEGDFYAGLAQLNRITDPTNDTTIPGHRIGRLALLTDAVRLGVVGSRPKPPAEEIHLGGRAHTKARDARAITHHYDLSNEFYSLVLGPSMTYSCAYWPDESNDMFSLAQAQLAKCRLVAGKLDLSEGMRVLDVGCGWGTFAIVAAKEYGASVVGITLSHEQAAYARQRVQDEGLSDKVEIRIQDYREISDGPFDAISSIGMAEHVGRPNLHEYAGDLFKLVAPQGRLLNHAISIRPGRDGKPAADSFMDRYVFPDGELVPMSTMVEAIEDSGFEVRDVESLREHYALTLRAWVGNLEANWDEAVRRTSEGRARVWRLYMVGSALTFSSGGVGINQILAVKPTPTGASGFAAKRNF